MEFSELQHWLMPRKSDVVNTPSEGVTGMSQFDPLRVWVDSTKTMSWLHESSRLTDSTSTSSFTPRDHEVAVPSADGDLEKWLVRPVSNLSLSEEFQTKLIVFDAENDTQPWLATGPRPPCKVNEILVSPLSEWLVNDVPDAVLEEPLSDYSNWLYKPGLQKETTIIDPLKGWMRYQQGQSWLKTPPLTSTVTECGSFSSLPLSLNVDNQWLATPTPEGMGGSLPATLNNDLDQWLTPSSFPSDQDSIASVVTIESDFDMVEDY